MRTPRRNEALVRITEQIVELAERATQARQVQATVPSERVVVVPLAPVTGVGTVGPLHGVPNQPQNHIRREGYLHELKRAVLGNTEQTIGITGVRPAARDGRRCMGRASCMGRA